MTLYNRDGVIMPFKNTRLIGVAFTLAAALAGTPILPEIGRAHV